MENKVEVQEQFIELRAKGNSYDRIAEKLGVSKSTLINWSKDLSMEIENERSIAMDAIYEKHKLTKRHRMEMFGTQLNKIRQELEKRDLADVPTYKLLIIQMKLLDAINNDGVEVSFESQTNTWEKSLFQNIKWKG